MKIIVVLALCVAGALATPHGYGYHEHKPDIRIESYTNAPPVAVADQPMQSNYGYHYQAPMTTTLAPPPADTPMQSNYYSYQPPMTTTSAPPPADTPMQTNYYSYQPPMTTTASPPADTPMQGYGGYNSQSSFKSLSSAPSSVIVRHHHASDNMGNYKMNVESSDGSTHVESGSLKNLGHPEGPTGVKEGSFSWLSPEGKRFTLTYTADENGFVAKGDHLPTSPPIPEEIKKSLALPRVHQDSYYTATAPASPPMNNYGYNAPPPAVRIESFNNPPKAYYK